MKKLLLLAIVVLGFSAVSFGQINEDEATASATIVEPIAITKTVDMNFGNIAVFSDEGGTVVLAPDGDRTPTDGVTLPTIEGTVTAASFDVTGADGYTYDITLPVSIIVTDGTNNMTVDTFESTPDGSGTLSASGTDVINVGATLHVGAGQEAGVYTTTTPFVVSVNYN